MPRPSRAARPRLPPLRIALTGGVASGKSTVAALFTQLGVPVIDTDAVAREVVSPGSPLLGAVLDRFGRQLALPDGSLDRRALRALIVSDPAAKADLEALLHPAIRERVAELSRRLGGEYQLVAIPLLAETGTAGNYDRVLVVDCPPELQLARLQLRDRVPEAQARALLAAQASREARLALAHDVLHNTGEVAELVPQVERLHAKYRQLAGSRA